MALASCSPLEVSQGLMHTQMVLIMSLAMLISQHALALSQAAPEQ